MSAQVIAFPRRPGFDPEVSRSRLASMWGCSAKTIDRYSDPSYTRPRGFEPLEWHPTPLGHRRYLLSEAEAWRERWARRAS